MVFYCRLCLHKLHQIFSYDQSKQSMLELSMQRKAQQSDCCAGLPRTIFYPHSRCTSLITLVRCRCRRSCRKRENCDQLNSKRGTSCLQTLCLGCRSKSQFRSHSDQGYERLSMCRFLVNLLMHFTRFELVVQNRELLILSLPKSQFRSFLLLAYCQ